MRRRSEAGHATLLLVAVVVIVGAVLGALVELGGEAVGRSRAQSVADLVALAAAHDTASGERVACANDATIVGLRRVSAGTVSVVVRISGREATAAAAT